MSLSRRRFLGHAAPLGLLPLLEACGADGSEPLEVPPPCCDVEDGDPFQHGVASGDPLVDAVILWTRVTPTRSEGEATEGTDIEVEWRVSTDPELAQVVSFGTARARASLDFTVKVDATGLAAGTTYYYDFSALGLRSKVGRTRTLPDVSVEHVRLAVLSCANFPAGFFNVYRLVAARSDIDLVLHLGDYLYEFPNGTFGDGAAIGRLPIPDREAISLEDYRQRHAQYKTDPDLQEAHRQHPFIAIWDDHEVSNNAYRDGAANHQPDSEGDWLERKAVAMQAYFEWMPIRSVSGSLDRVYREFQFGELLDLILLDTRFAGRDSRVSGNCDVEGILDSTRSLLGSEQESWFFDALRRSKARGAHFRLVGQQVMFGQRTNRADGCISQPDQWDGYAESQTRVLGLLRDEAIDNVVVLTGDAHSSWAFDLAEDPFDPELYDAATGAGSRAVEVVTPGVSSPGPGGSVDELRTALPHLKFTELTRQGYVLIDVDPERVRAEWYFAASVLERGGGEELGAAFETRSGENHLRPVEGSSAPKAQPPAPAPAY